MRPAALVVAGVLLLIAAPVQASPWDGPDDAADPDVDDVVEICDWLGQWADDHGKDGWQCADYTGPSIDETADRAVENVSQLLQDGRDEVDRVVTEELLTNHDLVDEVEVSTPDEESVSVTACDDGETVSFEAAAGLPSSEDATSKGNATPEQDGPCSGVDLTWLRPYYEGTVGQVGTPEVEPGDCALTYAVTATVSTREIVVETTALGGDRARSGCFSQTADVRRPGGTVAPAADEGDRYGIAPPPRRRLAERTADATAPGLIGDGTGSGAGTESAPVDAVTGPAGRRVVLAATGLLGAGFVGVRLYRRLSRDEILDNDLRSRIVEIVRDEPAIHASELARRLDVAVTTILYHGRMLAEADLVVMRRAQGEVVFLDRSAGDDAVEREALCVLRSDAKRRVVEALLGAPGANMAEIARRVERARNTVKHHVDDLIDAGLVEDRSSTRTRELVVPDEARAAIERHL